jgi:hypothetical protein
MVAYPADPVGDGNYIATMKDRDLGTRNIVMTQKMP